MKADDVWFCVVLSLGALAAVCVVCGSCCFYGVH